MHETLAHLESICGDPECDVMRIGEIFMIQYLAANLDILLAQGTVVDPVENITRLPGDMCVLVAVLHALDHLDTLEPALRTWYEWQV